MGTKGTSSSTPLALRYHNSFMLGEGPLPSTSSIQTWRKGDDGWVADSLGKALLLLEDVYFWDHITDEDIVLNVKWHSIAVSILPQSFSVTSYVYVLVASLLMSFIS